MSDLVRSGKRFNIVVSILIAVTLWFYVLNVENPVGKTMMNNIPVVVQGAEALQEKGLMVTELSRETVDIKAVGKRKTFLELFRSDVELQIDVSDLDEVGQYRLIGKVTPDVQRVDYSLRLTEKDSFAVTVTVKKQAHKEIPVVGEFSGTTANGYEAEPVQVQPSSIEVTGPEDIVDRITQAMVLLQGENLTENLTQEVPFVFMNENKSAMKEETLTCPQEMITATLPIVRVYDIPLKVAIKSGGGATEQDAIYTISPTSIKLSGDQERLENLKEIFLGEIDLAEIYVNKNLTFSIPIPEGTQNRSEVTEASVSVSLEELPMKFVTTQQITMMNAPSRYQVTLLTDSLQVMVRGKQERLDLVTGDHICVVVDLQGVTLQKGQQRVKASVSLEGVLDVGVVGTDYSVPIMLK